MTYALIVGGTRGIGRVIAQTFEARGDSVLAVGRPLPMGCLHAAYQSLIFSQRYRGTADAWEGEIQVSLDLTRTCIEVNVEHNAQLEYIVILSSVIARHVADEQPIGYHVVKSGVEAMVRYYAVNLGRRGVRVNGLAPGLVLKPENEQYYAEHPEKVEVFKRINPLGRMVTAQEVANVAAFLCSPAASAINGQIITVDGGASLHNPESLARRLTESK